MNIQPQEVTKVSVEKNMGLMQTLDDAWNHQDWDTFKPTSRRKHRRLLAGTA
jgi:hypothetical protein